ncbi:acyl-CoA thioesterase [Corynebacterium striatum]|uniref:acyl-CoA thioesterase n=1 Tax=Corynebacterium striatum TaxID=43770 RepID=UPI000DFA3CC6|nr:acyl-CoA thioesterase domain-containing protein [Corynebacterium striatum]STD37190.1 acyl-CoA thioesterase [Corynebacterium striatum]
MAKVCEVIDLAPLNEKAQGDVFSVPMVPSQIARTFGGQVVAQALAAAQHTVEGKLVHSLHGYFVGPGDAAAPARAEVERVRDGRSFATRQVRLFQDDRLIFMLNAGFHIADDFGPEHQDAMPEVMGPEEAAAAGGGAPYSTRIILREWEDWDIRLVPQESRDPELAEATGAGFRYVWFRNTSPEFAASESSQDAHRAALAYMSDMTLIRASLLPHQGEQVQLASLDHSIWFLRPVRVNEWLLYVQESPSAQNATGLATGKIFNQGGDLVAVVVQEGLTRTVREGMQIGSHNGNWQNV